MLNAWLFGSAIIGYILGSLPFGYLVARAHGVDIFKAGSGNPGATNVKRVLGAKAGNTVLVLDMLKGAMAAAWPKLALWGLSLCAVVFGEEKMHTHAVESTQWNLYYGGYQLALTGVIAAVIGHSFSIFTKFKGGKGVATAAGGLLVLLPIACAIAGATWVVVFYSFRYVSLASILAAVAVVAASWLLGNPLVLNVVVTAIGLFVILRHHENIKRLLNGTENKFAKKTPAQP